MTTVESNDAAREAVRASWRAPPPEFGSVLNMIVGSALSSDIVMSVRDFVTYGLVVTSFFVLLVYAFPIYILFLVLLMMLMIFSVLYIAIVCRQVSSANRRLDPRKFNDLKQRYDQEAVVTDKERELATIVARLLEQAKN